jgi:hypothetical protein
MLWCLRLIGVGVGRFDGINGQGAPSLSNISELDQPGRSPTNVCTWRNRTCEW